MRKLFSGIIGLMTFVTIVVYLLCLLAPYIDPRTWSLFAFLALGFPLVALSLFLLLCYHLFRKKRKLSLLIILVFCLSIPNLLRTVQLSIQSEAQGNSVRVMSYNVRLFGFYQWKENIKIRNRIFKRLEEEKAEVLCFQEFYYSSTAKKFTTKDTLMQIIETPFAHEKYTHAMRNNQNFGVVTLSQHPILHKGYIPFQAESQNFCIYTDILLPKGDTVRVFNAHLASIHFREDEYSLIEGQDHRVLSKLDRADLMQQKLSKAFKSRAYQIEKVMTEVERSPYPTIFAGDLNDTPGSYCYAQISEHLHDSFIAKGLGIGNSWNGALPFFRIDYLFYSDEWRACSYRSIKDDNSDHFPVIVDFELSDG